MHAPLSEMATTYRVVGRHLGRADWALGRHKGLRESLGLVGHHAGAAKPPSR